MPTRDFKAFWQKLETILLDHDHPSTTTVFNQYRDHDDDVDVPEAASIRRANLHDYLAVATERASVSVLVVGEAPGPWGTRFSGVPFVGEKQLLDPTFPYRGSRSSKDVPQLPVKRKPPYISGSAKMFWQIMLPYHAQFVVWDAFPLHPHEPGGVLSVRNPTQNEVLRFANALTLIKDYVGADRIVAVGRKAQKALEAIGRRAEYVRHPSMGGKEEFAAGMHKLFTHVVANGSRS
jgi:hypothetical protein